jgi:error-prone DNA polymerase
MSYVELHARSAFSFLRGASFPEELVETVAHLNMPALALCDRAGVYGAPRFFAAAKKHGVRAIIGAELPMEDGTVLPVLVEKQAGYKNLCRLLTRAHLRAPKTEGTVRWDELPEFAEGLVALTGEDLPHPTCRRRPEESLTHRRTNEESSRRLLPEEVVKRLLHIFGRDHLFIEVQRHQIRGETWKVDALRQLADTYRLPLLATNGVLYAKPKGRAVLDVFTCIRNHTHLDAAGKLLEINSNRYLRSAKQMRQLFADMPEAIDNTVRLAERLQFSLDNLGYEFPRYPVPAGESMDSFLRKQTYTGAAQRYRELTPKVRAQLDRELALIQKLGFPGYFLIVWDIINFCRESNIMVQGRGSAANSAVCFSLGITAVDPLENNLLFERFLTESRKGWPDIDLDLPSGDRREAVIQEVYQRYGRHGAAMTANVITYRGKSAAREIGKALNFSNDVLDRFSNLFASGDFPHTMDLRAQLQQAGIPPQHPRAPAFSSLYQSIYGLPRHLGQHSGGMIICQGQLDSVVPLENASMPSRTVAQWDKEDCEDLGIVKVDLLGLGMMSVMQDAIELTRQRGHPVDLAKIPTNDPATFEMMQKADTIGVFQIESRAQMATLPRMKPKCFYDVVIEVAIIRPGPIQGNMVHPFLARRAGREDIDYIDPRLEPVLKRTLGVPLFQEQMLKIAMLMADFSGDEAEELRRALSFHRSEERMRKVAVKLTERMAAKNVPPASIEKIIQSISSFALYGFPESHAISFAILAYGSAYLKTHYAPEFYSSLLNNQPMGFYSPATIVKDAKRHGLNIRPVCAMRSDWLCTIEPDPLEGRVTRVPNTTVPNTRVPDPVRLGFCVVRNLREEHARHMLTQRPFTSLEDFKARTRFTKVELRTLAEIGALNCFAPHRRAALWQVEQTHYPDNLFRSPRRKEGDPPPHVGGYDDSPLQPMNPLERLQSDFSSLELTTGPHPMALIRPQLKNILRAADLPHACHDQIVRVAGNVICRQRPGTAKGFVFISLEDETGISNAIVMPQLFEKLRLVITQEPFLLITGRLQHVDDVISIKAHHIEGLHYENLVGSPSHDFH